MSYACIDRDELNRRGLCEGVPCAPPSIIRETVIEPLLEPIFDDTPFSSSPAPWSGGGRWFGGGGGRRPGRRPPVWRPRAPGQHHGVSSGPNTVSGRPGRRVGGTVDRSEPQDDFPRRPAPSTSIAYARSPSPSYTAVPGQATVRSMAPPAQRYQAAPTTYTARQTAQPAQRYQAAPTTYTARPMAPSAPRTVYRASTTYTATPMRQQQPQTVYRGQSTTRSKSLKGLGQTDVGTSSRWRYTALGLAALAVAQFFWWNAKAPWVLRGKSY